MNAVELAKANGITQMSNYLLYNFGDKLVDLYHRLRFNIDLCERLDISIYSFPMKYHPIVEEKYFRNRNFLGRHWNRKYIRTIQCILNATKGKVGRGRQFFEKAFGKEEEDFNELLLMPEDFILFRLYHENNGDTQRWRTAFKKLTEEEKKQALQVIHASDFSNIEAFKKQTQRVHGF